MTFRQLSQRLLVMTPVFTILLFLGITSHVTWAENHKHTTATADANSVTPDHSDQLPVIDPAIEDLTHPDRR